jgi:fatty-acyl-CoA synthase
MAWVLRRPASTVSEESVREFCRGQIAHFKIPRCVKFVDSFPLTVTGKLPKYRMRESAFEELGLGKAAAVATA